MTPEITIVLAFQATIVVIFVFLFSQLTGRIDRLGDRIDKIDGNFTVLRKDLAEEFRAQRAEAAAQITAISNAIIASRKEG